MGADAKFETFYLRKGDAAVLSVRALIEEAASQFYFTSGEMIAGAKALGFHYTGGRVIAAAQYARRTGRRPAEVGAFYDRLLTITHEPILSIRPPSIRGVGPFDPQPENERPKWGKRLATDVFRQEPPSGSVVSESLLMTINRAAHQAGMRSRIAQFEGNVAAVGNAMAPGQGRVDSGDMIGIPVLFAEAGMGTERWQDLMVRTVGAIGQHPNAAVTAAKIAAVRKFMGQARLGAGEYEDVVDPSTLRGAMRIIESNDPRVMAAYARYAKSKSPGDEEFAKTIFQRMMPGLGYLDTERVWKVAANVGKVRAAGAGLGVEEPLDAIPRDWDPDRPAPKLNEPWRAGPMMQGVGGTRKSIAKERAEMDWVEWRAGIPLLSIATDIKEATVICADAFGDGDMMGGLMRGIDSLPWKTRIIIAVMSLDRGRIGAAVASVMLGGPEAEDLREGVSDFLAGEPSHEEKEARFLAGMYGSMPSLHNPLPGGRITHGWGDDRDHAGVDIAGPSRGADVVAAETGTIETMAFQPQGFARYGNVVVLRHANNAAMTSLYAHMDAFDPEIEMRLRRGEAVDVEAGQRLGAMGSTGYSTGPHLHFELRFRGQAIDPAPYFRTVGSPLTRRSP
mgnify:FL=1